MGPTLLTCALHQVGSYLGYTGLSANLLAEAAPDPLLPILGIPSVKSRYARGDAGPDL
jgi:hypothetical protein